MTRTTKISLKAQTKARDLASANSNAEERSPDELTARLLASATPANTAAAYRRAVDHFRMEWGGLLPASELSIVRYLSHYSTRLSVSTLKLRLAGIAHWHREYGFIDPTKGPEVKKVMKAIGRTYKKPPRQATPLPFDHFQKMVQTLESNIQRARVSDDRAALLRSLRNRALLLLGFWRGFRSDELTRVRAEHVTVYKGQRLEIFLGHSKTDSSADGQKFTAPALRMLCPVEAYLDWIFESDIRTGPVFRKIDRWGNVGEQGIYTKSLGPLLNSMAKDSGLKIHLSTHSMRHGFAKWAVDMGWDVHAIMKHVGWSNYENAARYVPARFNYGDLSMGTTISSSAESSLPTEMGDGRTFTAIPE